MPNNGYGKAEHLYRVPNSGKMIIYIKLFKIIYLSIQFYKKPSQSISNTVYLNFFSSIWNGMDISNISKPIALDASLESGNGFHSNFSERISRSQSYVSYSE